MLSFGDTGGGALTSRSFPARPAALQLVRRFIRDRAAEVSFHDEVAAELVLAVSEAAANAAIHSEGGTLEVTWRPVEGGAEVQIQDEGVFGPEGPARERGLGFGLRLMSSLCDEVTIERGTPHRPGTRVRLVKYRR